jgi:uncharacterized protein YecE (DUF72 family)
LIRHWFAHYAQYFDTVEINNTFYRLPSAKAFDTWRKQAPPEFCYVLKFSRYGSHVKRLKDPRSTIKRFLQVTRRLKEFLGPILVQLPPHLLPLLQYHECGTEIRPLSLSCPLAL